MQCRLRSSRRFVGGSPGWPAGIGALAIPGVGSLIAAGPIMAALSGAALGGIAGTLIGLGIPEYEAKQYEGKVKSGCALISVHSESAQETDQAKTIFQAAGAEDISSSTEPTTAARRKTSSTARAGPSDFTIARAACVPFERHLISPTPSKGN